MGTLVKIINNSITAGGISTILKTAIARPTYKSGCHNIYQNYHPY